MLGSLETILRLVIAALAGGIIGIERERLQWSAGLRTHMLVCLGSCLVIIVSAYGFSDVLNAHVVLDPSRVAAQVVSGIGFLGAGTILLRGEVVKGLTTAASLWAVAAIGLAVGSGLYVAALATTAIVLIILAGLKPIEDRVRDRIQNHRITIIARKGEVTVALLNDILGVQSNCIRQLISVQSSPETETISVTLSRFPQDQLTSLMSKLRGLPSVQEISAD